MFFVGILSLWMSAFLSLSLILVCFLGLATFCLIWLFPNCFLIYLMITCIMLSLRCLPFFPPQGETERDGSWWGGRWGKLRWVEWGENIKNYVINARLISNIGLKLQHPSCYFNTSKKSIVLNNVIQQSILLKLGICYMLTTV